MNISPKNSKFLPRFFFALIAALASYGCAEVSKTRSIPSVKSATNEHIDRNIEKAYLAVVKLENSVPDFSKNEHEAFYQDQAFWIKEGKVVRDLMNNLDALVKEKEDAYGTKEAERQVKSLLLGYQQRFGTTFHGLFRCIDGEGGMEGLRAAKKYVQYYKLSLTRYAQSRLDPVK